MSLQHSKTTYLAKTDCIFPENPVFISVQVVVILSVVTMTQMDTNTGFYKKYKAVKVHFGKVVLLCNILHNSHKLQTQTNLTVRYNACIA